MSEGESSIEEGVVWYTRTKIRESKKNRDERIIVIQWQKNSFNVNGHKVKELLLLLLLLFLV